MKYAIRALMAVSLLFAFIPSSQAGIGGSGGGPGATFMRFTICDDAPESDCSVVEYQKRPVDGLLIATTCETANPLERAALCVGTDTFMGWAQRLNEAYQSY